MDNTTSNAKAHIRDDVDSLKADLMNLKHDMSSLFNRGVSAVADKTSSGWQHAKESTNRQVHDKPITSLLIAAGVGALVGILMKSRH